MDIKIYVATHKKFILPKDIDTSLFIPIHCGKDLYKPEEDNCKGTLPELGDNTGINISKRNPHFSELTAMYWIWKNDKKSDIVGLNHYRRYFKDNSDNFITREQILEILDNYEFIVDGCNSDNGAGYHKDRGVYDDYGDFHNQKDIENALIACKHLFPELYSDFYYEIHHCCDMNYCNAIIAKKELFDEYCSFLFPVLFEVESKIDYKNDTFYDPYQARSCGFLSERLFRPWLASAGHTFKNFPFPCIEEEE